MTATAADGATAQATVVLRSVAIALRHGFTPQVILNAQLQIDPLARVLRRDREAPAARRVVSDLVIAARRLLPQFEMGCWARYELGGTAASLHYQTYHVDLLRRLAATRAEPIWRNTYVRWRRCLP